MGIAWILGGEEIAASAFKRTADGWIFKSPPLRRLFGLATHYKLDDAQKNDVKALFLRQWTMSMIGIVPLTVLLIGLGAKFPILSRGYDIGLAAVLGLALGLSVWVWYCAALRRRLAGATPTSETLTFADQTRTVAIEMPLWRILVFEGIALLMLAAALVPGESATYTTVHRVTGIVLFGASSLYFGALLVAKLLRRTGRA